MSYDVPVKSMQEAKKTVVVKINVSVEKGRVVVHLGSGTSIDMDSNQALALAQKLRVYARKARGDQQ